MTSTSFYTYATETRLCNSPLVRLRQLIDWEVLARRLVGIRKNEVNSAGGPLGYDYTKMFRALLLGQWHSLSDAQLEQALRVRLDFMTFAGFDLDEDVPDATTVCRFRNALIERGLIEELFREINRQLSSQGLMVQESQGAVIDATLVESAARPNRVIEMTEDRREPDIEQVIVNQEEIVNKEAAVNQEAAVDKEAVRVEESKDPDARWLKKGNKCYFGYKVFAVVDAEKGYIQRLYSTPANVSEVRQLGVLVDGLPAGTRVYADKGYASAENRKWLFDRGLRDGICCKAVVKRPLGHWQRLRNRIISSTRVIVERAFGSLKRQWRFARASYNTLEKVHTQALLKAMCYNMLKAVRMVQFA